MSVSGLKLGLMACLAVAAFAGEPGLRRDGAFWVEEGRGLSACGAQGQHPHHHFRRRHRQRHLPEASFPTL